MLKRIAVTGGIASGKTTVCRVFQELGAYVVSADQIVHQLLSSDSPTSQQVTELLGTNNRSEIANLVFNDPALLQKLEAILHPRVFEEIENEYRKAQNEEKTLFVAEVPLLFETGHDAWYDASLCVTAPKEACIKRYKKGDYEARMKRQLSLEQKAKKATYIIENNGSKEDLVDKAKKLFYTLKLKREIS